MGSVAAALMVPILPVADWSGTPLLHRGIGWYRRAAHQQADSWIASIAADVAPYIPPMLPPTAED